METLQKSNLFSLLLIIVAFFCLVIVTPVQVYNQTEKQKEIDNLIEKLKSENKDEVSNAAFFLKRKGKNNRKAIDALISVFKEKKFRAYGISEALEKIAINDKVAIQALLSIFRDDVYVDGILRKIAVNDETAIDEMLKYFNDNDAKIRERSMLVLGGIAQDNENVIEKLTEVLKNEDKSYEDGRSASLCIIEIASGNEFATNKLIDIIKNTKNTNVLLNVNYALNITASPQHKKIVETLIKLINENNDNTLLLIAANTLSNVTNGERQVIQSITEAVKKNNANPMQFDMYYYPIFRDKNYYKIFVSQTNKLIDKKDISSNKDLHVAFEELITTNVGKIEVNANPDLKQFKRNLDRLDEIEKLKKLDEQLPLNYLQQLIEENQYKIILSGILLLLLIFWIFVFWLKPIWLFQLNELLIPLTNFKLPELLGGYNIPLHYVLFIGFFHYHPRVLDAWVDKNLETSRKRFNKFRTVAERKEFIPLPVFIGKEAQKVEARELQKFYTDNQSYLLICGEGGSGKTSLACEMGRWATYEKKENRLCANHKMLPVLIEQNFDNDSLVDVIENNLRSLIDSPNLLSDSLIKELLKKRRVLLIIDGISEMKNKTALLAEIKKIPVNAVIFTSRTTESLNDLHPNIIRTKRIEAENIHDFIVEYLVKSDKRDLFEPSEIYKGSARLSTLVKDSETTALLAKLFADHMVYAKETKNQEFIPKDIPYLMLDYINTIKYSPTEEYPDPPDEYHFKQSIQTIAFKCIEQNYIPQPTELSDIIDALGIEGNKIISQANKGLRLIEIEHQRVRFSLDPLSEYLAGFYLVNEFKGDEGNWHNFIDSIDEKEGSPILLKGFLQAVRDCCLTDVASKVPKFVVEELDKKILETIE